MQIKLPAPALSLVVRSHAARQLVPQLIASVMPTEKTPAMSPDYEPIRPEARLPVEIEALRVQWGEAPLRFRVFMTVYLLIAVWGGLVGGHLLTAAYSNWFTWSVTLLILEPVGVASLAALIFLYWPNSWVGAALQKALGRAKFAALFVAACVAGWLAWVILYFAAEFWKLR